MFDVSIYKAEFHKICNVCLINSITFYYTREQVSQDELIADLVREGWLNPNNPDDLFWGIFRCETCRNPHLKQNAAIV
jgi:hypothetical protein